MARTARPRRVALYPLRILQLAVFGGDQPEDHLLVAGRIKRSGAKSRSGRCRTREEGIDINAAKQHLGNRLKTAFRDPC